MPQFLANDNRKKTKYKTKKQRPLVPCLSPVNQLLCGLIGLLLTICGTLIEAHVVKFPDPLLSGKIEVESLNITFQIGAVLLTGCLGGKNAGAISQIAYLLIGLFFLPVFDRGGTLEYIQQPGFGYLVGFIPGAWLCGSLAYYTVAKLENLALSSICGLAIVHLCGITYILGRSILSYAEQGSRPLELILQYSVSPLPGQLIIICAVATIAFFLRRIMFN